MRRVVRGPDGAPALAWRSRIAAAVVLSTGLLAATAAGCGGPSKPPASSGDASGGGASGGATAGEGSAGAAGGDTGAAEPGGAGGAETAAGSPDTGAASGEPEGGKGPEAGKTPEAGGGKAAPEAGGGKAAPEAGGGAAAADGGAPAAAPGDCADATSKMQDELMPRWDACWTKAPKKNRVPGKAEVQVRVDDSGKIAGVEYQGSKAFGKRASRCMVAATKATSFSAPACAGRTLTIQKNYGPGAVR